MKNCILLAVMVGAGIPVAYTQTHLAIPFASRPVMDGHYSEAEWADAVEVSIQLNAAMQTKVRAMHHLDTLYLAYLGNLESMNVRFPEVVIDPANRKGNTWAADQWWFHVSATDCVSQGAPNNYQNCQEVQPDWIGVPNIKSGPPITDTVEIAIPLSKIGVGLSDTFGIAFNVTNTFNVWNFWPPTAALHHPSSWATAVLVQEATAASELADSADSWSLFPNPSKGPYRLKYTGPEQSVQVTLLNVQGRVLHQYQFRTFSGKHSYPLETGSATLPPGTYWLQVAGASGAAFLTLLKF